MKTRPLLIAALAVSFGTGFFSRGLTFSERVSVIEDLRAFANMNYDWADLYARTPREYGWYWGQAEGLERAASYLEAYDTSGIRRQATHAH